MNINKFLCELAGNASRNFKIEQLTKHAGDETLREVVRLALDPFTVFYIKKIPTSINTGNTFTLEEALPMLFTLSNREQTGNAGIEFLAKLLGSVNEDDAEVIRKIISKDLKCGVSTSTANAVWSGLVPEYPCMLASPLDEKLIAKMNFPAMAQVKSDGMRFNAVITNGKCHFFTRNGKPFELFGNLEQEFLKMADIEDCIFDGELVVCDDNGAFLPRKTGNGILNKAIKGTITAEECKNIHAHIWDFVPYMYFHDGQYGADYQKRFDKVLRLIEEYPSPKIHAIEWMMINSIEDAGEYFEEKLSEGLEGIILKDLSSIWENKRSRKHIKFKAEKVCELRITGVVEGTGKYEGMLGAINCESEDGEIKVDIGSGFIDVERVELFSSDIVGKIVSVKYNEVIKNKQGETSLFLPIFLEIREDKNTADSSANIK